MGYPQWFWDWVRWMRDGQPKGDRPDSAPEKIPDWAWAGWEDVEGVGKGWGTTEPERDWIDWRAAGADENDRPDNVPDKIPERWWTDNEYVLSR